MPSHDRDGAAVAQAEWVEASLEWLGRHLGGATAFEGTRGIWRGADGRLHRDSPVVIESHTSARAVRDDLHTFLIKLWHKTGQAAVAYTFDGCYYEIALR